jgi:squalene-associated FAD-dependent desaturase
MESRARLGGLTHSFQRDGLWIDNGQHVFLRCCTAYQALLTRLGVRHLVALQPRLDVAVRAPGTHARLRRDDLPAPLHLARSVLRYPWLTSGDRARFASAALALKKVDPRDPATDQQTFGAWLRRHGQGSAAIETLWDLIGVATLNAHADDASLALAATVFQLGLLTDRGASDIGWSTVPLQRLHGDAAVTALEAAGVRILLRHKVTGLSRMPDGWDVASADGRDVFDEVVLAVPPAATESLLPAGAVPLDPGWAQRLGSSPIVNLHVVVDRQVLHEPFVAGVRTPVQWVFDRTAHAGLTEGQCLAVSLSAADDVVDVPAAELRQRFLPVLADLLPELRTATVRQFLVTRERHATFRPAPGSASLRLPAATAYSGLHLAGAWTDTGWPATMEGAVRSGDAAALALLNDPAPRTREVAA